MILPRFKTQSERRKLGHPFAEFRIQNLVFRDGAGGVLADSFVAIPCHAMADAAKAPAGGGDLGFQKFAHARADREVAAADDALGNATSSVIARCTHRRDAV